MANFANPEALECKFRAERYGIDLLKKVLDVLWPHTLTPILNSIVMIIANFFLGYRYVQICRHCYVVDMLVLKGISVNKQQAPLWLLECFIHELFRHGLYTWY